MEPVKLIYVQLPPYIMFKHDMILIIYLAAVR